MSQGIKLVGFGYGNIPLLRVTFIGISFLELRLTFEETCRIKDTILEQYYKVMKRESGINNIFISN